LNLFEPGVLSPLDADRTKMIQKEIERNNLKNQYSDESEFLSTIQMLGKFDSFNQFNTPRVAQLSERSNQYNLRTVRYTESDVKQISEDPDRIGFAISLRDNLGDHGLIGVIVLKRSSEELFIENWFMSCRVLKRGVEDMALNKIVEYAKNLNMEKIVGEYIPTLKNGLVKNHYQDLGFDLFTDGLWILNIDNYVNKKHYIKELE
jgi:FkbH-like protein